MKKKISICLLSVMLAVELIGTGEGITDVSAAVSDNTLEKELEQYDQETELQLDYEDEDEVGEVEYDFGVVESAQKSFSDSDVGFASDEQIPDVSTGDDFGNLGQFTDEQVTNNLAEDDEFGDGEEKEEFSTGDDLADLGGENQVYILEAEEGQDITESLNELLLKAKEVATDTHPCKVVIPQGNYELSGTICTYSNIYLYAEGATIKKISPQKQILLRLGNTQESAGGYEGYRNITIEGGTWDCNYESVEDKEAPGGFVGFRIGHASNVTIKNVTFLNNLKSHFLEFGGIKNASVTGCTFRGYWKGYDDGGQECIQIDSCKDRIFPGYLPYDGSVCEDIEIRNNVFEDVFAGVGSHSMMFDRPYRNITISNNTFKNITKRAVWCLNYVDSIVSDNKMNNVGGGVYVRSVHEKNTHLSDGQNATNKGNQQTENVVVSNNTISVSNTRQTSKGLWRSFGISVTGAVAAGETEVPKGTYMVKGITVTGNKITGKGHGIYANYTQNCVFTNNVVNVSRNTEAANLAFSLRKSSNDKLQGNTIRGKNGPGLYINGTSGTKRAHRIYYNTITSNVADGIYARSAAAGLKISKNTVSGNRGNGIVTVSVPQAWLEQNKVTGNQKNGIYIQQCQNIQINKNSCSSNKKAGIYILKSTKMTVVQNTLKKNRSYGLCCNGSYIKKYTGNKLAGNRTNKVYQKKSTIKGLKK